MRPVTDDVQFPPCTCCPGPCPCTNRDVTVLLKLQSLDEEHDGFAGQDVGGADVRDTSVDDGTRLTDGACDESRDRDLRPDARGGKPECRSCQRLRPRLAAKCRVLTTGIPRGVANAIPAMSASDICVLTMFGRVRSVKLLQPPPRSRREESEHHFPSELPTLPKIATNNRHLDSALDHGKCCRCDIAFHPGEAIRAHHVGDMNTRSMTIRGMLRGVNHVTVRT